MVALGASEARPTHECREGTDEQKVLQNHQLLQKERKYVATHLLNDSSSTHFRHLFSSRSPESDGSGINDSESLGAANTPARRSICVTGQL
jgi:hypothetical protein